MASGRSLRPARLPSWSEHAYLSLGTQWAFRDIHCSAAVDTADPVPPSGPSGCVLKAGDERGAQGSAWPDPTSAPLGALAHLLA